MLLTCSIAKMKSHVIKAPGAIPQLELGSIRLDEFYPVGRQIIQ